MPEVLLQEVGLAKGTRGIQERRGRESIAPQRSVAPKSSFSLWVSASLQVPSLPIASGASLDFCFFGIYSQKHLTLPQGPRQIPANTGSAASPCFCLI